MGSPKALVIEALAVGGRGVARPEGERVWFVSGALPGDRVEAEVEREHPRWVAARTVAILEPSPDRREPPCPLQTACGGCPWMALPESVQCGWKERLVADALRRIGGIGPFRIDPIASAPPYLAWRNRVEFSIGPDEEGRGVLGLYRADGRGLLDVPRCLLQADLGNRILASVRDLLGAALGGRWTEGESARLIVRTSSRGEALVVLRETRWTLPDPRPFGERLMHRHPEVVGVVRLRGREGRRGGARAETLAGRDWIEEDLGGTSFRLPAGTFIQANAAAGAALCARVVQLAGEVDGHEVLDLYGGVGAYAFALAARGARVTVCDADRDAIACGRAAAARAGRPGLAFVHADVLHFVEREIATGHCPALIVANPPRSGLGPRVARGIARLAPRAVVLVSCDPPTLSRDLRHLLDAGFSLETVAPFDLFPQTAHVEVVALLRRGEPASEPG